MKTIRLRLDYFLPAGDGWWETFHALINQMPLNPDPRWRLETEILEMDQEGWEAGRRSGDPRGAG